MTEALGTVVTIGVLVLAAGAVVAVLAYGFSRMPIEKKYEGSGGGLGGAFDAVWSPSAHAAGIERDRQTKRTAPAPSPGDPPSAIDGDRIVLDL